MRSAAGSKSPPADVEPVHPCNGSSPMVGDPSLARSGKWVVVIAKLDLTSRMRDVLGDGGRACQPPLSAECEGHAGPRLPRHHASCGAYIALEWPVVIAIVHAELRQRGGLDCFWSWVNKRAVPVQNGKRGAATTDLSGGVALGVPYPQWNNAGVFPPVLVKEGGTENVFRKTGYEYSCDFKWQCGCPRMLKVVRLWDAYPRDVFEVSATDHEPRHGCCHTLAPNACDFSGNYETTPSLGVAARLP